MKMLKMRILCGVLRYFGFRLMSGAESVIILSVRIRLSTLRDVSHEKVSIHSGGNPAGIL